MKIIKKHLTNNLCYKKAVIIEPKGIMLHSVGCAVERAENFIKSWNNENTNVSVHYFVEDTGNIYETLPPTYKSWHAGKGSKGSANSSYISVEMTEPKTVIYSSKGIVDIKDINYTREFCHKTYFNSVMLFATLCKKYNIKVTDKTIISHSQGYKMGIASNHGDVEHLWKFFDLNMDKFRIDVISIMQDNKNLIEKSLSESENLELKEVKTMKRPCDIIINGKKYTMNSIFYNEENYIRLRDLEKIGAKIDFDIINKIPSMKI